MEPGWVSLDPAPGLQGPGSFWFDGGDGGGREEIQGDDRPVLRALREDAGCLGSDPVLLHAICWWGVALGLHAAGTAGTSPSS